MGDLRKFAAVLLATGIAALANPATAQAQQAGANQPELNDAFRQLLSQPGNLQARQSVARSQVEQGNYEGAIATLEGQLLDPNAEPALRVELAALYYRLESYLMAGLYLRLALADPRLDAGLRASATALLEDIQRRIQPGPKLSGSLSLGLRAQSNPTAASQSDTLLQAGAVQTVPAGSRPDSDVDGFVAANLQHEWDFQRQDSATLVSTANLFANHYSSAADYDRNGSKTDPRDLVVLNLTSGIRFQPDPAGLKHLLLRPYLGLTEYLLDGNQYLVGLGGGMDAEYRFSNGATLVGATYDIRRNFYAERADVSNAQGQSGYEQRLQLRAKQELAPLQSLALLANLTDRAADRDFFQYRGADLRLTYTIGYRNPLQTDAGANWFSSLYVGAALRDYDGPDASVAPGVTRADRDWRIGVTQFVGLNKSWGLLFGLEYAVVDSNLRNYSFNNTTGMMSAVYNF